MTKRNPMKPMNEPHPHSPIDQRAEQALTEHMNRIMLSTISTIRNMPGMVLMYETSKCTRFDVIVVVVVVVCVVWD